MLKLHSARVRHAFPIFSVNKCRLTKKRNTRYTTSKIAKENVRNEEYETKFVPLIDPQGYHNFLGNWKKDTLIEGKDQ